MKNITDYIQQWANTYKDDMQNNIMPFWIKYGLDRVNGGIYTCVDRDGAYFIQKGMILFCISSL